MKAHGLKLDENTWIVGLTDPKTLYVKTITDAPMVWNNTYNLPGLADSITMTLDKTTKLVTVNLNKVDTKRELFFKKS